VEKYLFTEKMEQKYYIIIISQYKFTAKTFTEKIPKFTAKKNKFTEKKIINLLRNN
jgi:hypothetical protein